MLFLKRLGVILYKNLLLRRTQWFITALEVILPIFFVFLVGILFPTPECVDDGKGPDKIEPGLVQYLEPDWCTGLIYIRYAPNNTATTEAVEKMNQKCGGRLYLSEYPNAEHLLLSLQADYDIGIVFPDGLKPLNTRVPGTKLDNAVLSYSIRIHASRLPTTKLLFPEKLGSKNLTLIEPNEGHLEDYYNSKFLSIQHTFDQVLIEMITGQQNLSSKISLEMFGKYIPPKYPPIPAKSTNQTINVKELYRGNTAATEFIPPFLCFSILFMIPTITRNVVSEKQTGIGELLKSTGVSGGIQWLGWMINSLAPMLLAISICTILLFSRLGDIVFGTENCIPEAIFVYSDWTLVWFILFLHIASTIAMCFFICSVVKKPSIATTIALIISVVSTFLHFTPANKIMLSIFPNCALTFAYYLIERSDRTILDESEKPIGAQWNWVLFNYYFDKKDYPSDRASQIIHDVTMLQIMTMMIADLVVYSLLAVYFDNVLPSEFGVRRPWHFFNFNEFFKKMLKIFQRVFKKKRPQLEMVTADPAVQEKGAGEADTISSVEGSVKPVPAEEKANETSMVADPSFEPEVSRSTPVGIEVQNIYKSFGYKRAVNGVSLKMYEGDVFALLGHNGAGKTTLISVLTGFYSPTSGTAIVNGYDIGNDMDGARKYLGLCPQHNMLFDNISVIKQLVIFGMLRGMSFKQAKQESQYLLFKMNLADKKSTLARKLSGGQKRKLSLAMALIGGTKVVVLDEPTSGMDPQARREIWDLLLELRGQRTILLTTHFMEEADVLGDRIGIMAAGRVQCVGSAAFLKKYYGTGYTLKLTLQQAQKSEEAAHDENDSKTSVQVNPSAGKILGQVQKHVPDASIKKDARSDANSSEVFLTLPGETATTKVLTQMFTDLNGNKGSLGIQTIGLQQTTMDEVFLRVGEIAEEELGAAQKYEWTDQDFQKAPKLQRGKRSISQFIALLRKKWILFRNRWVQGLFEFLIPLILILVSILLLQNAANPANQPKNSGMNMNEQDLVENPEPDLELEPQPKLIISLDDYSKPITYYYSDNPAFDKHMENTVGSSSQKYTDAPDKFKEYLALMGKSDVKKYKRKMIIAVKNEGNSITAMLNSFPFHAAPLALNIASNLMLKALDPSANNRIQVTNHPWANGSEPYVASRSITDPYISSKSNFSGPIRDPRVHNRQSETSPTCVFPDPRKSKGGCVIILLAFILFTCPFILGPLEEKITNVKQLQLMTGLQPASFWLAHFVCDFTLYFILVLLTIFLVLVIEVAGFQVISINFGAGVLFIILMCYGFSSILLAYLLSLRSKTVAGGFALVVLIHLVTGVVFGFPLLLLRDDRSQPNAIQTVLVAIITILCYFFPSTPTLMALGTYVDIASVNVLLKCQGHSVYLGYLQWSINSQRAGVVQELFFVMLVGLVYLLLLILIEYKVCRRIFGRETPPPFPPNIYDDDVFAETERVNTIVHGGQVGEECMVIQNLSKAYGGFAAVSQLNFDVHYGECFGLLGVNGAGKTTVFKMITGEEFPSGGIVFGFGTTTVEKPRFFFSNIGYCPQFDAIFVVFTGREMLELFGVLRGLAYGVAKNEATKWLLRFGLIESANVKCGKYSGGMKRRLSTAMAMIGDPALLLLDEPTSGVDPVSRHQFWGILEKVRDSGKSIILTSHSMDECEALCSRLGIMVNGQFQCFGGVQHLKSKFAQGYSLLIKLKPDLAFGTPEVDEKLTKFQEKINETFMPCSLKDKHENLLQYHLENPSISWDSLFKKMEDVKKGYDYMIEDYSVNETSLEEVFLAFARLQYEERKVEITTCAQLCTCSC